MSERIVIGGLIIDNEKYHDVAPLISVEHFEDLEMANVYRHIQQFAYESKPFDIISIADLLGDHWIAPLGEVCSYSVSHGNILFHAKLMAEKYKTKQFKNKLIESIESLGKREKCQDVINELSSFMTSLDHEDGSQLRNIGDSMRGFVEDLEARFFADGEIIGLETGLKDLDQSIQGMQDGNLIIIASRPAMGKSVLAQGIAQHNAIFKGKNTLFFSLEMTELEIQQRMVSSVSNVDYGMIQSAKVVDSDLLMPLIGEGIQKIKKGKFIIDDSSSLSIQELKSKAISYERKNGKIDLLVVDYLQLLSAKAESRFQEVSIISRELKALAKTLKCPVIALSQLSRSLEARGDKRPIMSDLRESGQLEQDADKVIFIYRDEVYNEQTTAKGLAEIIVGKARNCPKRNVVSVFDGANQKFRDADHTAYEIVEVLKNAKSQRQENQSKFASRY